MSDEPKQPKQVTCACGNRIGETYQLHDGICLLDTGGGSLAMHYQGVCKACGKAVYFDVNQQKLDLVIKGTNAA